jgi:GntR family transcriptional repressor for pyruvate dehydrogenase complex
LPATVQPEFQAIRKNRVHEEVAKQLENLIINKLQPGDKLPAERDLAEKLGVSRSSIRDAMRRLHLIGLVEPRQGAGTVVREISSDALVMPLSGVISRKKQLVGELLDFRIMLEPPVAARAAENRTAEQVSQMEEILARQAGLLQAGQLAVEEDAEFHYCIAQASGNSVILKVLDLVMDLLRETRSQSLQSEGRPSKSLAGHKRILAAIRRKDPAAAETAMRQHIGDVAKIVKHKLV